MMILLVDHVPLGAICEAIQFITSKKGHKKEGDPKVEEFKFF